MWTYVVSFLVVNKYGLLYVCYVASLFFVFVLGLLAVTWFFGAEVKRKILYRYDAIPLKPPPNGLSAVFEKLSKLRLTWKIDKRLSGASIIDEPFNELLDLFMRDFVDDWYQDISKDEEFKYEVRRTIQSVVVSLSAKLRDVDFIALFTGPLLTDVTSHLRIFKKTQERLSVFNNYSLQDEIKVFFELESQFGVICTDKTAEETYVRNLVDMLLYLLLPKHNFHCYPERMLVREMVTTCAAIPTMKSVTEPDYVNQCFMAWLKDDCLTSESFLSAIQCCTIPSDLDNLEDRIQKDIQRLRAMDSGNIQSWKQQHDSLMYVLRQIAIQYENVVDPGSGLDHDNSQKNPLDATKPFPANKPCPQIPLRYILSNNISLKHFIDFMNYIKAEKFLYVWLSIDCFRDELRNRMETAEKEGRSIGIAEENMFRKEATRIYEEGLAEDAPNRIQLDTRIIAKLETGIVSLSMTPYLFDEVQEGIYNILNKEKKYYSSFKKSMLYYRCVSELDLNQDELDSLSPDEPGPSSSSFKPVSISPHGRFSADIPHVSMVGKDKQDALYSVVLSYKEENGDNKQWVIPKTFEEIKKFQTKLSDQFPSLNLPKASFFGGLDKDYISNRKEALNGYLKGLFDEASVSSPEMLESVMDFISSDASSGNPAVEDDPGSADVQFETTSNLDDEENIPLKVLILLTDEVFDMKNRNQWFRTRMVQFLRQIVRATFGGKINLKIQEYVQWLTSPEYISEMITLFKDSFWPDGKWSSVYPSRSSFAMSLTKFMAHTKLQGMVSDELKNIMGRETVREGIDIVFRMFQTKDFNKLLFYSMIESLLEAVFPDNKLKQSLAILRRSINDKFIIQSYNNVNKHNVDNK